MFKIALLKHAPKKKNVSKKFALVWKSGGYIVGEDFIVARKYCKTKHLILGLMILEKHNKVVYSFRVQNNFNWRPFGTINNTGNECLNRKNAFKDFFYNFLKKNQDDFNIFSL